MEIIGKTDIKYIVTMNDTEISNIAGGAYDTSDIKCKLNGENVTQQADQLRVGSIILVSIIYNKARKLLSEWSNMKKSIEAFKGQCTKFQNLANSK